MTTYRERREAKAERLRDWAGKREVKAAAADAGARALAEHIPFGQPILVGHHSEGRARRDAARINNGFDRAREHSEKAASMTARASGIEAQLDRSIYSDDPDAIEQLEKRIEALEAERARVKAYNASCRKGARDVNLLDKEQQADLLSTARHSPYMIGKEGQMPAYVLTNLGGNINRNKKRLEQLRRAAG